MILIALYSLCPGCGLLQQKGSYVMAVDLLCLCAPCFLVAIRGLFGSRGALTIGSMAERHSVSRLMFFDHELRGPQVIAFV
jgi:hypothetical protein